MTWLALPSPSGSPTTRLVPTSRIMSSAMASGSEKSFRSEEHTSELQSRVDLVCRLLLEKKKTNAYTTTKIRVNATCRKCQHKVHRMEMKTAISCTILRHTKILIAVGV